MLPSVWSINVVVILYDPLLGYPAEWIVSMPSMSSEHQWLQNTSLGIHSQLLARITPNTCSKTTMIMPPCSAWAHECSGRRNDALLELMLTEEMSHASDQWKWIITEKDTEACAPKLQIADASALREKANLNQPLRCLASYAIVGSDYWKHVCEYTHIQKETQSARVALMSARYECRKCEQSGIIQSCPHSKKWCHIKHQCHVLIFALQLKIHTVDRKNILQFKISLYWDYR